MILNIILFVAMYPCIFLIYYLYKVEAKGKKGTLFSVGLTSDQLKDDEVTKIQQRYRYEMKRNLIIFALIPFITLLIPYVSVGFSIWMIWLFVALWYLILPLVHANKALKKLKTERGWYHAEEVDNSDTVVIDTKTVETARRVKFIQFFPTFLITIAASIAAVIYSDRENILALGITICTLGSLTVLFYVFAVLMDRQRNEVVSRDSDVNIGYAGAKKQIWKNLWLLSAWLNTFYTGICAAEIIFLEDWATYFIWSSIIYTILLFIIVIRCFKKYHQIQVTYKNRMDEAISGDEDRFWIWGIIYYNPKDKRNMVPVRVGMGNSMNMARTAGKLLMGFAGLTILAIPVMCIWMIFAEFTPMKLNIKGDYLIAEQLGVDYKIKIDEIENLTVLDELPKWSKVSGTGMDNLEKGTFYVYGTGRCQVFVNPENTTFFTFQYNGKTYYMGASEDSETQEIIMQLQEEK